jgi:hypothetical protein
MLWKCERCGAAWEDKRRASRGCPHCGFEAITPSGPEVLATDAGDVVLGAPVHLGETYELVSGALDGRCVVVKRVRRELLGGVASGSATDRLREERDRLLEAAGPGVVLLLACVRDEASYVMPRYERTLATLSPGDAAVFGGVTGLAHRLGGTLARLHALGVVHRDVHPGNVLVKPLDRRFDAVVLGDFGQAWHPTRKALTPERRACVTPGYTAPEVLRRGTPTGACDVYSLAAVLYERVAGRRPHEHPDPHEELRRSATERPLSLRVFPGAAELPPDLTSWVDAALSPRASDRPTLSGLLSWLSPVGATRT